MLSFASNREEVLDMMEKINAEYDMYVPDMPVAGEEYFDKDFYNSNYAEIKKAYDSLDDADSKNAFAAVINYRISGKMDFLLGAFSSKREIYDLILRKRIKSIVDAGAYNGDTLREAIEFFPELEAAAAIEADKKNFKKLNKYAETVEQIKINCVNAAVWNENSAGSFINSGNRNSSVSSTASFEHSELAVELVRIDSVVKDCVDYIKYDVEGAEREALIGSSELIKEYHPVLLISLYHRSEDLFSLVNMMKNEYPDYSFYIRRLKCLPAWEIDLIMVPATCD